MDCASRALHWCSGALQYTGVRVASALVTRHAQPAARLVPPMRRCRETTTSCHRLSFSAVKRQPGALHEKLDGALARREHGKLGSGELQVNSIVPPLTFGLFASLLPPCLPPFLCLSLTCSTLLLFSFVQYSCLYSTVYSFAFTPHFSEARPACLHGRPPGTCSPPASGWKKRLNAS